jgi:glycosyltransferase involved in cell wall biosynthesis
MTLAAPVHPEGTLATPKAARRSLASSRPSRVFIATVERPDGDTGIHAHTRTLLSGFASAGIDATLVNPFSGGVKWLPIFALRRAIDPFSKTRGTLWYRRWHLAALRQNLTRALATEPPAVIIAQCPLSARAALDARRATGATVRIAAVCHFNHSEAEEYRAKGALDDRGAYDAILRLEQNVLESVDQVVYVSGWARRVVEDERHIQPRRSQVIWNGIAADAGVTTPAVTTPAVTRAALNLAGEDVVLINVGTLEPRKNQLGLLDLFAVIAAKFPQAKLLLVGDGPARADIERKVATLRFSNHVRLLGHRTDVPALLSLADLYVHYATLENCPVVLLEAARAALPSAAPAVGGIAELQSEIGGSVAIAADDLKSSMVSLRPVLANRAVRAAMGGDARAHFLRRFTQQAMIAGYVEALSLNVAASTSATKVVTA